MNSQERVELTNLASSLGSTLKGTENIGLTTTVNTPFGELTRINATVSGEGVPEKYHHKKHVFRGNFGNTPIIIIHYSGLHYGKDPEYFKRWYKDSKNALSGNVINLQEKRLFPKLYSFDDLSMTLVIEDAGQDMEQKYLDQDITDDSAEEAVNRVVEAFKLSWQNSKGEPDGFPRYVEAFLVPEYQYLREAEVSDYYQNSEIINLYGETQEKVQRYLDQINQTPFKRGFGTPDCKPANLIEGQNGQVMFIDVERYSFSYHWISLLGNTYHHAHGRSPESAFTKAFGEAIKELLRSQNEVDQKQALALFVLGRLNVVLIGLTLRNIAFMSEIKRPIPEEDILTYIKEASRLLKADNLEETLS